MDDILRFPSAVKRDRAIDAWLRAQLRTPTFVRACGSER